MTLHAPDGKRLVGFDNAHPVPHRGARHLRRKPQADHWHRTAGDKGRPYEFVSVERLLTPENRHLLAIIEEKKPASVAGLARLLRRAEPNVSRTLAKLVAAGFVRLRSGAGRTKVPEVAIHRLTLDIDVCHRTDRVAVA